MAAAGRRGGGGGRTGPEALCPGLLLLLPAAALLQVIGLLLNPVHGAPLSDYILHYEPVTYDLDYVHRAHHRVKRSADSTLLVNFHAHGRHFGLRLRRDHTVFTPDVVFENSTGPIFYDTHRTYIGHLEDEDHARVHGILTQDGLFEGKLITADDVYVIESAHRHFKEPQAFHSVIYKHSDVKIDTLKATLCKSDQLHSKVRAWQTEEGMRRPQASERLKRSFAPNEAFDHQGEQSWRKYSARRKRGIDPTRTTCTLYVQADHLYYSSKCKSSENCVVEQISQHIQGINDIYSIIDFDGNGSPDGISFVIKRIKVHSNEADKKYKFSGNYGVESYLELFSEDNFDSFCLAYMFTYRDFDGGTLGLAWTGDLQNAGGVCERNGQFRGSLKSLNTGIVTVLNYGKDVPSSVSHVTMAHEVGHNMGSQHDPDTSYCSPGGDDGNYIMYARATSGDKPNNNRFSACSRSSMDEIMEHKARGNDGCFIAPTNSICGNEVVEPGELCDCGWEECAEDCCFPQRDTAGDGTPCRLKPGAQCSPSEGPCCARKDCQLIRASLNRTCREDSPCKAAGYCNYSQCPDSPNKADNALCSETNVCVAGECSGSVCVAYGLEPCQCEPRKPDDFTDRNLCKLCCKEAGVDRPCKPSNRWYSIARDLPDLNVEAGSPCYKFKGYCDVFQKCRAVDPAGPLSNLKAMFFSAEGIASLKSWVTDHWYVAVAAVVGLIIFMILFVKLCSPKKREPGDPRRKNQVGVEDKSSKQIRNVPPPQPLLHGYPQVHSNGPPVTAKVPPAAVIRDDWV